MLDEERKAAAAPSQATRAPAVDDARPNPLLDDARPNPLFAMPMSELRALAAQLEADLDQTMQHHKHDMVGCEEMPMLLRRFALRSLKWFQMCGGGLQQLLVHILAQPISNRMRCGPRV